jgi:hypothetical protein
MDLHQEIFRYVGMHASSMTQSWRPVGSVLVQRFCFVLLKVKMLILKKQVVILDVGFLCSYKMLTSWENHHCEKHGNTQISLNHSHKLWKRLAPGMPGRSYQTKPGLPSGCQVNNKCVYAKCTISSLTLMQKVIPGYLQRTELTCGLFPMIFRMVFPSCLRPEESTMTCSFYHLPSKSWYAEHFPTLQLVFSPWNKAPEMPIPRFEPRMEYLLPINHKITLHCSLRQMDYTA